MNDDIWKALLHRSPNSHKYTYGHVLIIGGSVAMTGAPILAARAALRVGAGLVTIASTEDTVSLIDRDIEEMMTLSLPPWSRTKECIASIQSFIKSRHVSVLVIGPGLPQDADEVIRALIAELKLPMVADAESFTALSDHLETLELATAANKEIVLTPHPGEYDRLVQGHAQYSEGSIRTIRTFAYNYQVVVALKQNPTIVASPTGELYENTTGNPGLATAGAGDVLAGMIAGIRAQKVPLYESTKMAVRLHGLAGDSAANTKTQPGMIASDIIEAIPKALQIIDDDLATNEMQR